jgi:predicted secreted protein
MEGYVGRELEIIDIATGFVCVAGVRNDGISVNNEPIDVTYKSSDGIRRLLEESAQSGIDLSIDGICLETDWLEDSINRTNLIKSLQINHPAGIIILGKFRLNSYEEAAPYNEALTFTASLQSCAPYTTAPTT